MVVDAVVFDVVLPVVRCYMPVLQIMGQDHSRFLPMDDSEGFCVASDRIL